MRFVLCLLVPFALSLSPVRQDEPDAFEVLRPLVGHWKGSSDGKFGKAELEKSWELVLDGKFLQGRNRSVSAVEIHEDLSMISWDEARGKHVLREFNSEGYVNRYVMEIQDYGETLVFETEAIENAFAPGLRARTTITFVSDDEIDETFCLATGDEPYEVCVKMKLMRVDR